MWNFPSTLKRLIFNGCQVARLPRFFTRIDDCLQLLEELSLEKCPWFETHDLVVFSKLPHLKRLILRGCSSLKSFVPYGSIATRYGFKALEVNCQLLAMNIFSLDFIKNRYFCSFRNCCCCFCFVSHLLLLLLFSLLLLLLLFQYLDVRDTPIADSDIQCFNITATLREILLDCPIALRKPSDSSSSDDENSLQSDDDDKDGDSITIKFKANSGEDQHRNDAIDSSETESELSSDSEDGDSDDDAAKANANDGEEQMPQQHAHFIQVVLQNGRLLNVNAERSVVDNDNRVRELHSGLRCVIGIINGRGLKNF